jgi:acyl carrier protein
VAATPEIPEDGVLIPDAYGLIGETGLILSRVTEVLSRVVAGLRNLSADQDYYDAGFSSLMALTLLMEIEDRFQVTIPDQRFIDARTARSLAQVISEVKSRESP